MGKTTFWDRLFIALVLSLSTFGFAFNASTDISTNEQKYVTVQVDTETVKEYSFDLDTEKVLRFPFQENSHEKAELEINEGGVRMLPMDRKVCPQGICSETGWIQGEHQSIVCFPNKIVITLSERVIDKDIEEDIDGVTN